VKTVCASWFFNREVWDATKQTSLGCRFGVVFAATANAAMAQDEIKIGEINSYSLLPAFTEPYRKGWQLAVEEINAAGGVNGKKLVVISKDDAASPPTR